MKQFDKGWWNCFLSYTDELAQIQRDFDVTANAQLKAAGVEKIAELTWNGVAYGSFLSAVINFIIVGTTLFFVVKAANHATALGKKEEAAEEDAAPSQEELLAEIRDLLANK